MWAAIHLAKELWASRKRGGVEKEREREKEREAHIEQERKTERERERGHTCAQAV